MKKPSPKASPTLKPSSESSARCKRASGVDCIIVGKHRSEPERERTAQSELPEITAEPFAPAPVRCDALQNGAGKEAPRRFEFGFGTHKRLGASSAVDDAMALLPDVELDFGNRRAADRAVALAVAVVFGDESRARACNFVQRAFGLVYRRFGERIGFKVRAIETTQRVQSEMDTALKVAVVARSAKRSSAARGS